ncbi:YihY/virulence factor BrkB family protein [Cellulomonas oligotrophica]|uniref:Membrane protein n=1 Tax=Cellulomonas oligotrophica TaxID=931536 RepID=A0A7Y9FIL0_9CELL|nr:YihY/virulence factor BrkB family protein [Cellulomonas oligotrophica]NYD87562.1 membrane protein [Cellulomonas oligotrophica]GIG33439.1 hypothetical protein Col01nite_25980 [Cellulomonas oligotrophica]
MTRAPDPGPSVAAPPAGAGGAHVRAASAAPDPVPEQPSRTPVERAKALLDRWQHTRAARALTRFGQGGGPVLTGGIAYASLFSVFAGLTIGWTVFMAVLGGNAELRATVLDTVADALPGLLTTPDEDGLISPDTLVMSTGLSVAGVVAVVVLLVSAISAVSALRRAVRAMFDAPVVGGAVIGKARELAGFVGLGVAVLLSAVLGIVATAVTGWVLDAAGWSAASTVVLQGVGVLVAFVVDAAVFVLVVRVLAGQDPPRRDLLVGACLAGAGLGVVRLLGTSAVSGSVEGNPVLGSFAAIVVLLLWINLIARVVLLAAAWTADPPYVDPQGDDAAA